MPPGPDVRPLAAAAAVTALAATGVVPAWAGVPHHVALPPLDLFADVRVLFAEAPSYPWFAAGLVVVLGLRAAVLAAVLRSFNRSGVLRALRFYCLALPAAAVAGALAFAGVAAVYSEFLWTGVALAVLALVILGPRPWPRPIARGLVGLRLAGYLGALLVLSLLSTLGGNAARVALVWASAGLTAAAVSRLGRPERGRRRRAGAALPVVVIASLSVAALAPARPPAAGRSPGTLFVVPGNGGASGTSTMFRFDPAALGYECASTVYFSYAGPGGGAPRRQARCPIRDGAPYHSADTRRPLGELAGFFRAQLATLDPPVVVVAHSQGGWVAAAGLAGQTGEPAVDAVVLLGGFPGHRAGYHLDGAGRGLVGTDALEALSAVLRRTGGTTFDPRAPLARRLLGIPGAVGDLMAGGLPAGVRVVTVTSAFDLPVMAGDRPPPGALGLCPVFVRHGRLPLAASVAGPVRRALDDGGAAPCGWWRRWPAVAFSAFGVPIR